MSAQEGDLLLGFLLGIIIGMAAGFYIAGDMLKLFVEEIRHERHTQR